MERLGQVIVAADFETTRLVVHILQGAEEDDRQLARRLHRPQRSADLVAVDVRHHDIEQNQVGRAALYNIERLPAAERNRELVVTFECLDQNVDIRLHIVDDQHPAVGQFFHWSLLPSMFDVRPRWRAHGRGGVTRCLWPPRTGSR